MRKFSKFVAIAVGCFFIASLANAAPTIRAGDGAHFRGEINANGQKFVCWRGFTANFVGDFGARNWLHPFKDNAQIADGCTPLMGDGSLNLYWVPNPGDPNTRQALLVSSGGDDGLSGKLGANICRAGDSRGAKLLVTPNPAGDPRCIK